MTRIVDIVDNWAGEGLVAEHGLSLQIEHAAERILFDTGAGVALVPNARALGIDLGSITHVVLSHSHYDHTGGPRVLSTRSNASGRPHLRSAFAQSLAGCIFVGRRTMRSCG